MKGMCRRVGIGLKSIWRFTPIHERESRNEKDSVCETQRRREWRKLLDVSVMEREARVWNGYSRITEIDWNDCLLQRSDWRLMITLGWREGRNGLGIKHQIGMEVEWKEWNGV